MNKKKEQQCTRICGTIRTDRRRHYYNGLFQARASLARYYGVSPDSPLIDDELVPNKKKSKLDQNTENQVRIYIFLKFRASKLHNPTSKMNAGSSMMSQKLHFVYSRQFQGISWIFNPFGLDDDKMRVIQQAAWLGVMVKVGSDLWSLALSSVDSRQLMTLKYLEVGHFHFLSYCLFRIGSNQFQGWFIKLVG